jgi:hypothetical protein
MGSREEASLPVVRAQTLSSTVMTTRATILAAALLAPGLLSACQTGSEGRESSVNDLVIQGQFPQALAQARDAWEQAPDDPQAIADYRHASVVTLLERGRDFTFADEDEKALAEFAHAMEVDPEDAHAQAWHHKTRKKLSDRWYQRARDLHTADDLFGAADAYEVSLKYDADNAEALEGLYRVGVQLAYRDGLSEEYYNEGLQALRESSLFVARSRFTYAGKYRAEDAKPVRRRTDVDRRIAEGFAARGLELEAKGYYAAAKVEFRMGLRLDENNHEAGEGYDRMLLEAEVHELYKRGEMWIRRGEWDKAVEVLNEGMDRTKVQQEDFVTLLETIDDLRAQAAYKRALNFEHDFRFVDAIAAYDALIEERGFFEDARSRSTRLQQMVAEVEQLYAGLDALEDPKALKDSLQRIDVLWPEYRDVQERLGALEGADGPDLHPEQQR